MQSLRVALLRRIEVTIENDYQDEIARNRAERHKRSPAIKGFEKPSLGQAASKASH